MKLTDYILYQNERPITWGFVRAWVPARASRYSWLRAFLVTVAITGLAVALSWAVIELVMRIGLTELVADRLQALQPWILGVGAEWAGLAGFCWSVVSRLCWNQRSSRPLEMADSPESNPALHRRGFLAGTLPGWGYFFTIAIATPTLLFYAIENARGAWAWNRMQARLKADGVCYELGCNVPPPASDNENFFATPFWSNFAYRLVPVTNGLGTHPVIRPPYWMLTTNGELASHVWATNPFRKQIYLPPVKPPHLVPTEPRYAGIHGPIDLAKWATAFREAAAASASTSNGFFYRPFPVTPIPGEPADDVLLALTLYDDQMAEFASAAARPRNRYPAHYEELSQSTPLAYLSSIRTAVEICQLRAIAHLAKGNTEAATTNSVLGFRLAESLNEEILSVSHLVRYASDAMILHTLWEGTIGHQWTDAQLRTFQDLLSQREYSQGIIRSVEAERVIGCADMERAVRHRWNQLLMFEANYGPDRNGEYSDGWMNFQGPVPYLMPTGWMRKNQIHFMEGSQMLVDAVRLGVSTDRSPSTQKEAKDREQAYYLFSSQCYYGNPEWTVAGMLLQQKSAWYLDRFHCAQSVARMAVIACGLERYRIVQNRYPKTLEELIPTYLAAVPTDWMGGKPFHYQPTDDGWFRLWSVGPNGIDDGGVLRKAKGNGGFENQELDWPWPSRAKTSEALLF